MTSNYTKQAIAAGKEPANPYSAGLVVGDWVFVAGHGPTNPNGEIEGADIEAQASLTLRNVQAVLEKGGCSMNDCVKVTVHLSDMALFQRFNAVYRQFFSKPYPVRTTVEAVLEPGQMVEIDAVAFKGAGPRS